LTPKETTKGGREKRREIPQKNRREELTRNSPIKYTYPYKAYSRLV
jgi:hypothetical protein